MDLLHIYTVEHFNKIFTTFGSLFKMQWENILVNFKNRDIGIIWRITELTHIRHALDEKYQNRQNEYNSPLHILYYMLQCMVNIVHRVVP